VVWSFLSTCLHPLEQQDAANCWSAAGMAPEDKAGIVLCSACLASASGTLSVAPQTYVAAMLSRKS